MALDESAYNNSGLSIPRFVSLKSDKVFVRTGPALRYPIKWVFIKEGLPVFMQQNQIPRPLTFLRSSFKSCGGR